VRRGVQQTWGATTVTPIDPAEILTNYFSKINSSVFIGPVVPAWTTSKWPLRNNYVPFIPDRRIYSPRSLSRTDSAISQSAWRHRYHVRDLGLITVVLDRKFPGQF
jgi:hypothetical protein